MLSSVVIHNSFFSDVCMDDIANMKYQIFHLHLEQYCIQQKYDQSCQHLC